MAQKAGMPTPRNAFQLEAAARQCATISLILLTSPTFSSNAFKEGWMVNSGERKCILNLQPQQQQESGNAISFRVAALLGEIVLDRANMKGIPFN